MLGAAMAIGQVKPPGLEVTAPPPVEQPAEAFAGQP